MLTLSLRGSLGTTVGGLPLAAVTLARRRSTAQGLPVTDLRRRHASWHGGRRWKRVPIDPVATATSSAFPVNLAWRTERITPRSRPISPSFGRPVRFADAVPQPRHQRWPLEARTDQGWAGVIPAFSPAALQLQLGVIKIIGKGERLCAFW
jgi:hypothetical protein